MAETHETLTLIDTIEELHYYLKEAMVLEHATIPPYLTALYSIKPGTNVDAYNIIRVVVVEEMLHLTLAANLMNAVGGTPSLTFPGFVPDYPAYLPDGETDFVVNLERLTAETVENFLQIERPAKRHPTRRFLKRSRPETSSLARAAHPELHFYSIGEFYAEIIRGLDRLHEKHGDALFSGDPKLQVTPEYYYSGGGRIIPIVDIQSAKEALTLISEQGEGDGGSIEDEEGEISHYFRFQQLLLGRYYVQGDRQRKPTGDSFTVDWGAVYPVKTNAKLADYGADDSELQAAAVEFNTVYMSLLGELEAAFTGRPELLIPAVARMFRIKQLGSALMRNPLAGADGLNAAPTFEMTPVAVRA